MTQLLRVLPLFLAGCASAPAPPPQGLSARLGQEVELQGVLRGPAKFADFIEVDGAMVYLPRPAARAVGLRYGDAVRVRGRLEHTGPAPLPEGCTDVADCPAAQPPEAYVVRAATVEADR